MSEYLNTLTVKTLKEIAKRIGFRFISTKRKAELVELIAAHIEWEHIEAIREDKIRAQQAIEAEARKIEEHRIMEALANHPTVRPAGIVVAPVEIQIPAMVGPYGYTAHGNTYAVDYNRIHEEMTRGSFAVQAETSTEKGDADIDFTETSTDDSVSIDSFLLNAHKTLSALAKQAKEMENETWDRDEWVAEEWTTVAKDLASALANVEWSLNYRASKG